MRIYLASPLFTPEERTHVKEVAYTLRKKGHRVYVPMEHEIKNAWEISNAKWGERVFDEDIKAIRNCDKVVAIYYGLYSDSGTAWEMGFAYGIGKPVEVINVAGQKISLMIANSIEGDPFDPWQEQT